MADRDYCSDLYEEEPGWIAEENKKAEEQRKNYESEVEERDKEAKYLAGHIRYVLSQDRADFGRTPDEISKFSGQVGFWRGFASAGKLNTNLFTGDIALQNLRRLYGRLRKREKPLYDPDLWVPEEEEGK